MPKVSVLMPVYKTPETYLRTAIESILNQTFSDFEFLILDDFPPDSREEIVLSYNDSRIKYSKNERNIGISASRNKLIDMAKGDYLAIFDHDDVSLPERLAKEVAYMEQHPEVGVVGSKVKYMGNKHVIPNFTEDADIKLALMKDGCAVVHSSSMIRKSILDETGIRYEEKYSPCEDYALWCRLSSHTSFHNLGEILLHYRDHAGNTSSIQRGKMQQITLALWALAQVENPQAYQEYLLREVRIIQIRLFGFIPLIKIRKTKAPHRVKTYLFGFIPLFTRKEHRKLQ